MTATKEDKASLAKLTYKSKHVGQGNSAGNLLDFELYAAVRFCMSSP